MTASEYWEGRYGEREQIWSGRPNAALVATVSELTPGRALDLGCGEGGDAVWLAAHGWRVTAVDASATAIERARGAAAASGVGNGEIEWVVADLATWRPAGGFDLVAACFLHSPLEFPRTEVLRRCAETVVSGGHLLVVGHAAPPPWSRMAQHDAEHARDHDDGEHHHDHEWLTAAEELAQLALPADEWATVVAEDRTREATGPDGEHATLEDSVVLLRRR